MFSMAEDLTSFVPCQKRTTCRPERALYVPLAKRLQLSGEAPESLPKDGENFFMEGLFTPLGNNSLFDQKLQSMEDSDQLSFDQQGKLTEQCFSELIKTTLKLPPMVSRERSTYLSDPMHGLDYRNFENNNTTGSYFDSDFYDCGKDVPLENSTYLATIGEEFKDEDFGMSVLKGATRSYEDFKSKEFRTKIERNFSSPVLSSQSPVTDCGRLSAGSNPAVSTTNHPILDCANCQPDAEDLEVAMINESFEEQQKQSKIFESSAMKNFFYAQSNKPTEGVGLCSNLDGSLSHLRSDKKGSHERMPYTAAISNNKKRTLYKDNEGVLKEHYSPSMNASMTLSEDDIQIPQTDVSDLSGSDLSGMRSSHTYDALYHRASLDNKECARGVFEDDDQKLAEFDVEEMILDDAALQRAAQSLSSGRYNLAEPLSEPVLTESRRDFVKAKKKRSASDAIPIGDKKQAQLGSADDKLDATAAIALNVVESLFAGGNSLDHSSPLFHAIVAKDDLKRSDGRGGTDKRLMCDEDALAPAVKNVFDAYRSTLKQSEEIATGKSESISPEVDAEILKAINDAVCGEQQLKIGKQDDVAVVPSCDSAVDSWEELDSDDSKLVDEIQSAMGKVRIRKPKIDYFAPPEASELEWNEKELPNVLEAYGLPARISYDDIKHELAKFDCADVTFQRVDDSHCLIAFSSANAALNALIAARQRGACPWLRLRSMCDASTAAQEKARMCSPFLKPYKPRPQTTMVVARRLVENALGKRSNVSVEQRRAERKQLTDARVQKEARAALWEDIS